MTTFILKRQLIENRIFPAKQPHSIKNETAYVYVNKAQKYKVVQDGERLSRSELGLEKYNEFYMVNTKIERYEFKEEVESSTRGRRFAVELHIDIAVDDPGLLIQKMPGDIVGLINRNVPFWIKSKARQMEISRLHEFESYLRGFYNDSSLVSLLNSVGVCIKDVRVFIDKSVADKIHDNNFVGEERTHELKTYSTSMLSQNIYGALNNNDILTAINLAEGNPGIRDFVLTHIKKQNEFKDRIVAVISDPKIDLIERNEQIKRIQESAELYDIKIGTNMTPTANESVMQELDNILYSVEEKG